MEMTPAETNNLAPAANQNLDAVGVRQPGLSGAMKSPAVRQLGLMLGLAVSMAIGVAAVLWSQSPDYGLLYGSIDDKEVGSVLEALDKLNVKYKVESSSGAVMVPSGDVHEVRLKLAAQGLPKSTSHGFELLEKESGFGTSQSLQTARHQRALEGEIARSIMAINTVKSARLHLALPKQSVFVRKRKKPSASVFVELYSGRGLEKGQTEAIVHMVASSVPQLEAGQVTLVDQRGHLLNSKDVSSEMYLTSKQFEYKKQVEEHLIARIENIISPLVGSDGLRTQVTADVDFTVTERTQEHFNPDLPALRSEQVQEENNRFPGAQGIPGALSNQPPAAGTAPEVASSQDGQDSQSPKSARKSATRNYELDKSISHSRMATGELRRLSVALVVDDRRLLQADGSTIAKSYSQEDLNRFTDLVKQAIGYDASRGDRVTVTNLAFRLPDPIAPLPDIPIWEQAWFHSLVKQVVALSIVLFLIIGVIRPAVRALTGRNQSDARGSEVNYAAHADGETPEAQAAKAGDPLGLGADEDPLLLEAPQSYEKRLEFAQKLVDEDPKRVAQVIKTWVAVDA